MLPPDASLDNVGEGEEMTPDQQFAEVIKVVTKYVYANDFGHMFMLIVGLFVLIVGLCYWFLSVHAPTNTNN